MAELEFITMVIIQAIYQTELEQQNPEYTLRKLVLKVVLPSKQNKEANMLTVNMLNQRHVRKSDMLDVFRSLTCWTCSEVCQVRLIQKSDMSLHVKV